MFEREQPPLHLSDAVLSTREGERQIMTLPPQMFLMYLGWENVCEWRAPAPYVRERSQPAAAEPAAFIAALWLGVAVFAGGALWLAFH